MKSWIVPALALGLSAGFVSAEDKPDLTDRTQRISYALGMDVVRALKVDDFDIDMKVIAVGMEDTLAGKPALTREEQKMAMKEMQEDILNKAVAKKEAAGDIHRKEGAAFLAANAKKEGVKIKEVVAPDGSKAGMQYRILKSGKGGPSPAKTGTVVVNFTGTLIDGTVFDSSAKRNETATTFDLNDVVAGWVEALQMMKVGDRWQLFLPPTLAFNDFGPPEIGIHTTVIYELELISFEASKESGDATKPATTK